MSVGVKSGRSNFLYYNTGASEPPGGAAPTWAVIDRIGDLDRANSKSSTEVDMRASPTTIVVYGNKSREVTFTYYKREGATDAVFNALQDSYENDTVLDVAISEGDLSGTPAAGIYYDRGPFIVAEMTKSEPIAGVDAYDITLNVADATYDDGTTPFLYLPGQVTS